MPRLNSGGWTSGDIKIHAGTLDDIPNGWELADEMIDRAVVGAGGAYEVGQQFGADEATPIISTSVWVNNHTLSIAQMPSHSHKAQWGAGSGLTGPYTPYTKALNSWQSGRISSTGSSHAHNHGAGASSSSSAINTRQKSIAVIWIRKL